MGEWCTDRRWATRVRQVDSEGNVNVTKRGEGAINYVGPGGFIDLTTAAKIVVFCTSCRSCPSPSNAHVTHTAARRVALPPGTTFYARGKVKVSSGSSPRVSVNWAGGTPCFVPRVDEVTFSGQQALKRGQRVCVCLPRRCWSQRRRLNRLA